MYNEYRFAAISHINSRIRTDRTFKVSFYRFVLLYSVMEVDAMHMYYYTFVYFHHALSHANDFRSMFSSVYLYFEALFSILNNCYCCQYAFEPNNVLSRYGNVVHHDISVHITPRVIKYHKPIRKRYLTEIKVDHDCLSAPCESSTDVRAMTNMAAVSSVSSCLLNIRSMKNKLLNLHEFICDNSFDFVFLTETWAYADESDLTFIMQAIPPNYKFIQYPRQDNSGHGGVGVIFKDSYSVTRCESFEFKSFEHMVIRFELLHGYLLFALVYRPPPSANNTQSNTTFVTEFDELLQHLFLTLNSPVVLLGDFNVHMDVVDNPLTRKISDLLETVDAIQFVSDSTHDANHILDLVIARKDDIAELSVIDPILSDHRAVIFRVDQHPQTSKKVLTTVANQRRYRSIHIDRFSADLAACLVTSPVVGDVNEIVSSVDDKLKKILDQHAPEVTVRRRDTSNKSHWMTFEILQQRRQRRALEKKWRLSRDENDRLLYQQKRDEVNKLIIATKRSYYAERINETRNKPKALFRVFAELSAAHTHVLPKCDSDVELAEAFGAYFESKIQTIHDKLVFANSLHVPRSEPAVSTPICRTLNNFEVILPDVVANVILSSNNSSCIFDTLPTWLLKRCLPALLPYITAIFNCSITSSSVPVCFKKAVIKPLLKKSSLDSNELRNYRPVSNLPFLSKVFERCILKQIKEHLIVNSLFDKYQSAYREYHSTETLLIRLHDDILKGLDNGECVLLLLLDLSAAFDTLDHHILFSRLETYAGVSGPALQWLKSYISDRSQCVQIRSALSDVRHLKYGVPQGSVLGPLLFTIYMLPVGEILSSHGVSYQFFADDTQMYISCRKNAIYETKSKLEDCINELSVWMRKSFLKLNADKSEFMIVHPRRLQVHSLPTLTVDGDLLHPESSIKDLGVMIDSILSVDNHINHLCKTLSYQIRLLSGVRKYIDNSCLQTLIAALFTSRLDYANALLVNAPAYQLDRLQRLQNTAARLLTLTHRYEHITPVLYTLHWLPVKYRIEYKIALTVFKVLSDRAPEYLKDLIVLKRSPRVLRSTSDFNMPVLKVPRSKTKSYGDRRFSVAAPLIWNRLPAELRATSNLKDFKRDLKTFYFQRAYL